MEMGQYEVIFTESKPILPHKKGDTTEWHDYRTLSLVSHATKVFKYLNKNIIKTEIEQSLDDDQFGFRPGIGTTEAILILRKLLQRRTELNRELA